MHRTFICDKAQVQLVNKYLWINRLYTAHKVKSNNRCMWTSIRRQFAVRQKGYREYPYFPNRLLRRIAVMCLVRKMRGLSKSKGVHKRNLWHW